MPTGWFRAFGGLKPGGRFAAEMGGHGCVAAITVALCATLEKYGVADPASLIPWYFPTADDYCERLERTGFQVEYIALIPRPTPLPTGMRGWLEPFAIPFTNSVAEEGRAAFLDAVTERPRPALCDEQGRWTALHETAVSGAGGVMRYCSHHQGGSAFQPS